MKPNKVQDVAFNGIYNVRFPKGTPQAKIQEKAQIAQSFLQKVFINPNDYIIHPYEQSMRIITANDNPWMLTKLFSLLGGEDLAHKYVEKAAVNLDIDI